MRTFSRVRRSWLPTLALLFSLLSAQAQADWRPFRVGHTHTFQTVSPTPGVPTELKTIRLAAGTLRGADSVYAFAPAYRFMESFDTLAVGCPAGSGVGFPLARLELNTPVGAEMAARPDGDYLLRFTTGATLRLRSRGLRVGASWPLCANPAITATIQRREVRPVGTARVADSVVVVRLSGAATGTLVLSKRFGLLELPELPVSRHSCSLELLTIPERGLGELPNTSPPPNWQAGDSVVWFESAGSIGLFSCYSTWSLTRFLTRRVSADTTYRTGTRQRVTIRYGAPGCMPAGTVVDPPTAFSSFQVRPAVGGPPPEGRLLGQLVQPVSASGGGYFSRGAYFKPADANGCMGGWRYRFTSFDGRDTCNQTLLNRIDSGDRYETLDGFGVVSRSDTWGGSGSLMWFRNVAQRCGDLTGFPRQALLAAPAPLPAEQVSLSPNPATAAAALRLTGTSGGALTVTVLDALGRRVWQHQQAVGADAEVALPAATWARGTYLVRVALGAQARTLRLVRE